jgi:hypothetical protein
VVNSKNAYPEGVGLPLNGIHRGGGIALLSSYVLDKFAHFHSTLEHELGHAFGLPHVTAYGYDMKNNDSIMSYNKAHWWSGFRAPKTPGILIPEDIRSLALNRRAFTKLRFDPSKDIPSGYTIAPVRGIAPPEIPGQPSYKVEVLGFFRGDLRELLMMPSVGLVPELAFVIERAFELQRFPDWDLIFCARSSNFEASSCFPIFL